MSKFKLAFGIHNHQPVGNFEHVFESAHSQAYFPFLKLVSSHKNFRMSLHQSGILWNWQKEHRPEYLKLVGQLVKNGQLEILTGGFYEPILCAIPERDALGQIKLLSQYISDNFKKEAAGLWLTERVWEPQLPEILSKAAVQYVPVDDAHFIYAGFEKSQLNEPFVTESNGYTVKLLPIQQRLRYLIPFGTIEQVISELKIQAEANPHGLAIYADDGEKFGVWPETYKHCYEDKWLESFFEALEKNSDWLEVIPLGEAAERKPAGRAYLPTASYSEMLHWALPEKAFVEYEHFESWLKEKGQFERFGRFVRGGHWRNFLAKYEESNLMHKKMLNISNRLAQYESNHPAKSKSLSQIKEFLYSGQCNCPYWHGVFGGLYLPHIRQAVYSNLLEAEQKLNRLEKSVGLKVREFDFDSDGANEILVSNEHYSSVFKSSRGGTLVELSLLEDKFSLTDTLSRRREGYHHKLEQKVSDKSDPKTASIHDRVLSKEKNLDQYLISDWYLKRCFIDHFFSEDVSFDEFKKNKFKEDGDFILEPYQSVIDKKHQSISLSRQGNVWRSSGTAKINLKKSFVFTKDGFIKIKYCLSSPNQSNLKVRFGIENNFSFQAGHADDRFVLINGIRPKEAFLDSTSEQIEVSSYAMVDDYRQLAVAVESDRNSTLWRLPIFTVSLSEGGFEKVYQGTTLLNLYDLNLSKAPIEVKLTLWAGNFKHLPAQFRIKS